MNFTSMIFDLGCQDSLNFIIVMLWFIFLVMCLNCVIKVICGSYCPSYFYEMQGRVFNYFIADLDLRPSGSPP